MLRFSSKELDDKASPAIEQQLSELELKLQLEMLKMVPKAVSQRDE